MSFTRFALMLIWERDGNVSFPSSKIDGIASSAFSLISIEAKRAKVAFGVRKKLHGAVAASAVHSIHSTKSICFIFSPVYVSSISTNTRGIAFMPRLLMSSSFGRCRTRAIASSDLSPIAAPGSSISLASDFGKTSPKRRSDSRRNDSYVILEAPSSHQMHLQYCPMHQSFLLPFPASHIVKNTAVDIVFTGPCAPSKNKTSIYRDTRYYAHRVSV